MVHVLSWGDLRAAFAEFVAMAVYVFFGCGALSAAAKVAITPATGQALDIGFFAVPFVWGFLITVLIFTLRTVGSGHVNPAVTLALILSRNIPIILGLLIIISQVLGAVFGAAILRGVVRTNGFVGAVQLGVGVSEGEAFAWEAILTFFWVFTFLCTMIPRPHDHETAGKNVHSPIPIGLAVFTAHIVGIPFSGCGINPARVLGPAIIQDTWDADHHWLYWVGPLIGSVVATVVFYILYGTTDNDGGHPHRAIKEEPAAVVNQDW
jgi:aquaporin PIP